MEVKQEDESGKNSRLTSRKNRNDFSDLYFARETSKSKDKKHHDSFMHNETNPDDINNDDNGKQSLYGSAKQNHLYGITADKVFGGGFKCISLVNDESEAVISNQEIKKSGLDCNTSSNNIKNGGRFTQESIFEEEKEIETTSYSNNSFAIDEEEEIDKEEDSSAIPSSGLTSTRTNKFLQNTPKFTNKDIFQNKKSNKKKNKIIKNDNQVNYNETKRDLSNNELIAGRGPENISKNFMNKKESFKDNNTKDVFGRKESFRDPSLKDLTNQKETVRDNSIKEKIEKKYLSGNGTRNHSQNNHSNDNQQFKFHTKRQLQQSNLNGFGKFSNQSLDNDEAGRKAGINNVNSKTEFGNTRPDFGNTTRASEFINNKNKMSEDIARYDKTNDSDFMARIIQQEQRKLNKVLNCKERANALEQADEIKKASNNYNIEGGNNRYNFPTSNVTNIARQTNYYGNNYQNLSNANINPTQTSGFSNFNTNNNKLNNNSSVMNSSRYETKNGGVYNANITMQKTGFKISSQNFNNQKHNDKYYDVGRQTVYEKQMDQMLKTNLNKFQLDKKRYEEMQRMENDASIQKYTNMFGFSQKECQAIINPSYQKNSTQNRKNLIKQNQLYQNIISTCSNTFMPSLFYEKGLCTVKKLTKIN